MTSEVISRQAAISLGLKRYFTGKPCKSGHIAAREVVNHTCVACVSKAAKNRYKKNPGPAKARRAAQYQANKPAERAAMTAAYRERLAADPDYNRKNYMAFREKRQVESRIWARENPAKRHAQHARRKAAKRNAVPGWFCDFDEFAMIEAADLCRRRAAITGYDWQVDHMIPLQAREACGLHVGANLQVIPAVMNISKKNKMELTGPGEWLKTA